MLEVKHITKVYGRGKSAFKALDDVNIEFGSKGLVVILGKSGCGKSTLLNIMGGLDQPTEGEVIINGQSTKKFGKTDFDAYRNTFVGIVFQEFNLIDEISVFENINMTMKLQDKNTDTNTVDEALAMVGLGNLGYRKPSELSGGQRQRVALARALLKKPEIILADEPTGALDSVTGEEVFESLKKIALTKLVIVVTHNRDLANTYADRIVEIVDGKIVSDKSKDYSVNSFVKELSDNVVEISTGGQLTRQLVNKRLKKGKINYIGLSHDKDRIALAYPETVDSFYAAADSAAFLPTSEEKIPRDSKPFKLSKGRLRLKDAVKMARGNIKRSKKRYRLLTFLMSVCFTFLSLALIMATVSVPTLTAKASFDAGAQPLITVGQKSTGYSLNKLTQLDMQSITSVMGNRYAKGIVTCATPELAIPVQSYNFGPDDYYRPSSYENTSFLLDEFNGILEVNSLSDVGLKAVYGADRAADITQILISDFAAATLVKNGFVGYDAAGKYDIHFLREEKDLIGARICLQDSRKYYTVAGIYETNYKDYKAVRDANQMDSEAKKQMAVFAANKGFLYKKIVACTGFGAQYKRDKGSGKTDYEVSALVVTEHSNYYMSMIVSMPYFSYSKSYYDNGECSLLWAADKSAGGAYTAPQKLEDDEMIVSFQFVADALGTYPFGRPEEILNEEHFQELISKPYDIKVSSNGSRLKEFKSMRIVGITHPQGRDTLMISAQNVASLVSAYEAYDMLYFEKGATRSALSGKLKDLSKAGMEYGCASADLLEMSEFGEILGVLGKVFIYIALGTLILAFLIIFNYMSASIRFRTKEIAVYRVIGAKPFDVAKIFLAEGGFIVVTTSIAAIILSFLVSLLLNVILGSALGALGIAFTVVNFNWLIEPVVIVLGCALTVVVSSLLPISGVTRKRPVEAVKMI